VKTISGKEFAKLLEKKGWRLRRLIYMKAIKAKEIEKKFDEGEDISKYLDISKARRPHQEQISSRPVHWHQAPQDR